ncbi:MAG: hypothetical protein ABSC05_04205 [Candidatus Solibacter sp.]|jgi:hypothetical protein
MKWLRLMFLAAVAGQLAASGVAADPAATSPGGARGTPNLAPVLRPSEPPDSVQVTLPGPPPVTPIPRVIVAVPPVAKLAPLPRSLVQDASLRQPIPLPVVAAVPVKPSPRLEMGNDAAAYCRKQIGHWKESDARKLLGEPSRHRPAYDERKAVNGAIYAFPDPTNKYKELELDFDLDSGALRTVFAYPPRLTWDECRRLWNGPAAAADAAQGRKFYSYTHRRLDVLVDPAGKVISLGWY